MPDAEAKLKVTIETAATGSGAPQTASGLKEVAGAAGQAAAAAQKAAPALGQVAHQSGKTAQELGRGVEIGNAAVATLTNIASSGQGGASGLIAITRAGFSAGTMFKGLLASMGPFGIAAAAVGIALGLISSALRKSEEGAEAARKKLEELNKQKLDKAVEEQGKLKEAAGEALAKIEAEYNALERIADAELNRRKSANDALVTDGKISAEERDRRNIALDRQREDEKRANLLGKEEAQARKLEDAALASAEAAKKETDELTRRKAALDELAAARKARTEAEAMATLEEGAQAGSPMASGGVSPETARAQLAARDRVRAAEAGAKGITPDQVDAESEAKVKAMQQEAAEAQKRAREARAAVDLERKTQAEEKRRIDETRKNEDRAKTPQTEAQKAAIEQARQKAEAAADAKSRLVPAAQLAQRMRNGMDVDIESARRVYPLFKFPEQQTAPGTPMTPSAVGAQPTAPRPPGAPFSGQSMAERNGQTFLNTKDGAFPVSRASDQFKESADKINESMTSAAKQEAPDLKPAADASKKIAETQKATMEVLGDYTQRHAAAAEQFAGFAAQATATIQAQLQKIASLDAKVANLSSQVAAMRSQRAA